MAEEAEQQPVIAVRSRNSIALCKGAKGFASRLTLSDQDREMQLSPDGSLLAVLLADGVGVFSVPPLSEPLPSTPKVVCVLSKATSARHLAFSPNNHYLITGERWNKDKPTKNINVWALKDKDSDGHPKLAWSFSQKGVGKENWPVCHWTNDYKWMVRLTGNEVVLHDAHNPAHMSHRLKVEGVTAMSLSPSNSNHHVVAFVAGNKGRPSRFCVIPLPDAPSKDKTEFVEAPSVVASKSMAKAQSMEAVWNKQGSAVIVKAQTDVDTTGKTYYGESRVMFWRAAAPQDMQMIGADIEGPVHAVGWDPAGKEFIVIQGLMPAKAVLYNSLCKPKFDFGQGHRNSIHFNGSGRLLCLGGFGNLSGSMEFFEKKGTEFVRVGSARAQCTVSAEWSPDGRHFLTSVCAPRMRVDNGFRLWKYDGSLVHTESIEELYETLWQPCRLKEKPLTPRAGGNAAPPVDDQPRVYRAPGASGRLAEMLRREREDSGPRKVAPQAAAAPKHNFDIPVGADPEEYARKMKKKERELKKKQKKAAEKGDGNNKADNGKGGSDKGDNKSQPSDPADKEKRVKALKKKLRQIDQIKEKVAAGSDIDDAQKQKLNTEGDLLQELQALEQS